MRANANVVTAISIGLMALGTGLASAQTAPSGSGQIYPNKPIRIVTAPPGGGGDTVARLIAQNISISLGQPVVVDNRGGVVSADIVAKARPDGYTLLSYGAEVWLRPFLQSNTPYDPVRDYAPITLSLSSPGILVVHPSLPVKSVKELIAYAKTRNGELNYAMSTIGASQHLAAELFKVMAGVNITRVAYKGSAPANNSLLAGETHLAFPPAPSVMPYVKSGKLTALAITSSTPSALAPGIPTLSASGLTGFHTTSVYGMLAPAGTPVKIINQLNQEIVRGINKADVKEKFFNLGLEVVGNTPEQFAVMIKSEMARMGKVI